MPKEDNILHNYLNTNILPPPIDGEDKNDFTYSIHLAKLLRRFVRIAVPDVERLGFSDLELLDDVMRYGNLSKIAKLRGCSEPYLCDRFHKILDCLDERVAQLETAQANDQAQQRIEELERQLAEARSTIRRLTVASARDKSMAVEAYLRESKN